MAVNVTPRRSAVEALLGSGNAAPTIAGPPGDEIGAVSMQQGGLPAWRTFVEEQEYVPELTWPNSVLVYHRMRSDSQIEALHEGTTKPVRDFRWSIDPNNANAKLVERLSADFGLSIRGEEDEAIKRSPNRFSFDTFLTDALLGLIYGVMNFEIVGDQSSGNWRMVKRGLSPRHPRTFAQIVPSENGELEGIRQFFSGRGASIPELIPAEKLVNFVWRGEAGSLVGRSMLRGIYREWLVKDRVIRAAAINVQRGGGVPVAEGAPGMTDEQLRDLGELARTFKVAEGGGGAIPYGSKLTLAGGSVPEAVSLLRYLDECMARVWSMMLLQLGQTSTGSRALGAEFSQFAAQAQRAIAGWVEGEVNAFFDRYTEWNEPDADYAPRLHHEQTKPDSLSVEELVKLVESEVLHVDPEFEAWLRDERGLPEMPEQQKDETLGTLTPDEVALVQNSRNPPALPAPGTPAPPAPPQQGQPALPPGGRPPRPGEAPPRAAFDRSKHPRDKGGQFAPSGAAILHAPPRAHAASTAEEEEEEEQPGPDPSEPPEEVLEAITSELPPETVPEAEARMKAEEADEEGGPEEDEPGEASAPPATTPSPSAGAATPPGVRQRGPNWPTAEPVPVPAQKRYWNRQTRQMETPAQMRRWHRHHRQRRTQRGQHTAASAGTTEIERVVAGIRASVTLPDRELRRLPSANEIRAAVDFRGMDAAHSEALAKLQGAWLKDVTPAQIRDFGQRVRELPELTRTAVAAIPALPVGQDLLEGALHGAAASGVRAAVRELQSQGMTVADHEPQRLAAVVADQAGALTQLNANAVVLAGQRKAASLISAGGRDKGQVARAVEDHLVAMKHVWEREQLRGAVTMAQNAGRFEVFAANDEGLAYEASELLDNSTCDNCAAIDGTVFANLDEAMEAYAGGGYVDCEGGPNCRGTVVAVSPEQNPEGGAGNLREPEPPLILPSPGEQGGLPFSEVPEAAPEGMEEARLALRNAINEHLKALEAHAPDARIRELHQAQRQAQLRFNEFRQQERQNARRAQIAQQAVERQRLERQAAEEARRRERSLAEERHALGLPSGATIPEPGTQTHLPGVEAPGAQRPQPTPRPGVGAERGSGAKFTPEHEASYENALARGEVHGLNVEERNSVSETRFGRIGEDKVIVKPALKARGADPNHPSIAAIPNTGGAPVNGPGRERAAYLVGQRMGLPVPSSIARQMPDLGETSVMRIVPNGHDLDYNAGRWDAQDAHDLALLDYVTGNLDRHAGQALEVSISPADAARDPGRLTLDGAPSRSRIIPIDHNLSFPDFDFSEVRPEWSNNIFLARETGKPITEADRAKLLDVLANRQELIDDAGLTERQVMLMEGRIGYLLDTGEFPVEIQARGEIRLPNAEGKPHTAAPAHPLPSNLAALAPGEHPSPPLAPRLPGQLSLRPPPSSLHRDAAEVAQRGKETIDRMRADEAALTGLPREALVILRREGQIDRSEMAARLGVGEQAAERAIQRLEQGGQAEYLGAFRWRAATHDERSGWSRRPQVQPGEVAVAPIRNVLEDPGGVAHVLEHRDFYNDSLVQRARALQPIIERITTGAGGVDFPVLDANAEAGDRAYVKAVAAAARAKGGLPPVLAEGLEHAERLLLEAESRLREASAARRSQFGY